MFDDYLVKKQVVLDYKNIDFKLWPFWDFFKGVNPWFWSIKNWILQSCHTEIFYMGVNSRLWSKIANFLFVCLVFLGGQNKSRNKVWWSSPQPIEGVSNLTINKSFFPCNESFSLYKFLSTVSQQVNQSTSQSVSQSLSMSISQTVSHQPVGQSIIQPVSLSVSPAVSQSASQSVSQSVNDFGQKLQISFSFVLGKNRPWSSV